MAELCAGDIFLNDYDILAARIVKFLMKYPTLWHFLFGRLWGWKPDEVRYYHAGIVLDRDTVVEQQWKVRLATTRNQIFRKPSVVWRCPFLTENARKRIVEEAVRMVGRSYDWLQIVGKLLTWLTGLKWFERKVQFPTKEMCCTLVARCYFKAGVTTFGKSTWMEVTTDDIDDYCQREGWIKVYEGG